MIGHNSFLAKKKWLISLFAIAHINMLKRAAITFHKLHGKINSLIKPLYICLQTNKKAVHNLGYFAAGTEKINAIYRGQWYQHTAH